MQKDLRDTKNSSLDHRDVSGADDAQAGQFILTNPIPAPVEAASVGELLLHARELQGLSAEDVAAKLRMGLKQVKAIECANYSDLPSGTFLRGFVRNYAKAVGVDTALALATLERTHGDALAISASAVVTPAMATKMETMQTSREALATPKVRIAIAIGIVLLLAAAVWYWWENVRPYMADGGRAKTMVLTPLVESASAPNSDLALSNSISALITEPGTALAPTPGAPPNEQTAAIATGNQIPVAQPATIATDVAASALIASGVSGKNAINNPANNPASTSTAVEPVPPILNTKSAIAAGVGSGMLAGASASAPAGIANGAARIGFTFTGQSWVEVTDKSGATILSRKFNAGESEEITGRGPFTITVGNATATRMAYNGREFDLTPHRRANSTVARVNLK